MDRVSLPHSALSVYPICLGSGTLGSTVDRSTSFRLLDAYMAAGGNFIDTAKVYADWLPIERSISEKTIGAWLRQRGNRNQVVLSTKGAHPDLATMHIPRLSPAEITGDLHVSLEHLGVETIDLYWLHRDDPARPVSEILETLARQVQAGKIRYFGCSNWKTERIREAQLFSAAHGLPGFIGNQMMWSLATPDPSRLADKTLALMDPDMWRYHLESGLPAIPYTSQAGGYFTKLAENRVNNPAGGRVTNAGNPYDTSQNHARLERIRQIGAQNGLSITQIVLGYLRAQPFTTVPIVGPKSLAQLEDCLTAADVHLAPEQVAFLEQ
jgi:aryl-alcohol dehydrogenase-like predicted oxidoreductase